MSKPKKYIVVQEEDTYWTDSDAPEGNPKAVGREDAKKALEEARSSFPQFVYRLKEVK